VEYAASLIGMTVNCTELLRTGEVGDEEASAVSAALTTLREIWNEKEFTAKDVVKVITPEAKFGGALEGAMVDDMERSHADALRDALSELAGKSLDKSTARSLGKLFQKRLVGRPVWIGEGKSIATLRKSTGHDENSYWVDLATPGQPRSACTALTSPPSRRNSSAAAFISGSLAAMIRSNSFLAHSRASSSPMPVEAPVTTASLRSGMRQEPPQFLVRVKKLKKQSYS
jgi:hypothetical protein